MALPMLLAAVLALAIGASLGLLGGGGSILTVPILVYVVGLETKSAIATSLLVVGVTSLAAMLSHARHGRVRWKEGFTFGAASMVGAYSGGRVAHFLPGELLLGGFTVVMVVTGIAMMRKRGEGNGVKASLLRTSAIGLGAGALTGVVGAGGGFVVVPALAMLGGLAIAEAVATSLLVIGMNSFAGLGGYLGHVHLDLRIATVITVAAVLGSFVGAAFSRRIRPESLRRGFAVFVLVMAAVMAVRQIAPHVHPSFSMHVHNFTPIASLVGGILIGVSVTLLLVLNGRIAGISGIVGGLIRPREGEIGWRAWFVGGLLVGGAILLATRPETIQSSTMPLGVIALAGVLVGFGTRLGSGCTSGHGVCGMSRFSPRSIVATVTFMTTGALATFLVRHVAGLR